MSPRSWRSSTFRIGARRLLLLSNADRGALDASLAKDPFYVNGVAEFDVEEFHASRVAPGYENLLDS